jgi:hypothetical protein
VYRFSRCATDFICCGGRSRFCVFDRRHYLILSLVGGSVKIICFVHTLNRIFGRTDVFLQYPCRWITVAFAYDKSSKAEIRSQRQGLSGMVLGPEGAGGFRKDTEIKCIETMLQLLTFLGANHFFMVGRGSVRAA